MNCRSPPCTRAFSPAEQLVTFPGTVGSISPHKNQQLLSFSNYSDMFMSCFLFFHNAVWGRFKYDLIFFGFCLNIRVPIYIQHHSLGSYMTGCWNHRLFWWTIQICHTPEGCTNMNSIMTNLSWMFRVNHPGCTRGASRVITALLREVHFCQRDVCFHHSVVCWWTTILYKRFWNFFVISFAFGVFPTLACGTCLSYLLAGSWL